MDDKRLVVSVGRNFGSGGHLVAKALADKLGFALYDSELLTKAAEKSGISSVVFGRNDEARDIFPGVKAFFQRDYGGSGSLDSDGLFQIQSEAIVDIASRENAVIVGRCSDYVLRQNPVCKMVSIFVTAPIESRIARVCDREGLSEKEAIARIEKKDRQRATYYNRYTFGDWGVASGYDLCIDTSLLGIDATADYIADFLRRLNLV